MASYELDYVAPDDEGVVLVALSGELDLTNADELGERLSAVNGDSPLVLDLNRVVFIDSAAIHRLFRLAGQRRPGGLAFVVDPSAPVATTLEIVELDRAAAVTRSLEEAKTILAGVRSPLP